MKITGTFIDEISHDIPHQNWGEKEWDDDFRYMKNMGIDTVIMIRCGYRKFLTYPSNYLIKNGCHSPPTDLVDLFLRLSEKNHIQFYFGLYDSGHYWDTGELKKEIEHNRFIIEEAWHRYGHYKAFKGWYISTEISRKTKGAIQTIASLGKQCKEISQNLPVFISPWIDGKKAVAATEQATRKNESITLKTHEAEWSEILDGIKDNIDSVAFQDGHVDYHELADYLRINKKLTQQYNLQCWTNAESFDRDMPIKYLPIKMEKLRLKLEAADAANYDKAITFEFSHFMSPQSMYLSAHNLYNRYFDYLEELANDL